jgi:hypothetical protein
MRCAGISVLPFPCFWSVRLFKGTQGSGLRAKPISCKRAICRGGTANDLTEDSMARNSWTKLGTPASELLLDFTLPTGQSFRWRKTGQGQYTGVIHQRVVRLLIFPFLSVCQGVAERASVYLRACFCWCCMKSRE